jgi:hypothetical protein
MKYLLPLLTESKEISIEQYHKYDKPLHINKYELSKIESILDYYNNLFRDYYHNSEIYFQIKNDKNYIKFYCNDINPSFFIEKIEDDYYIISVYQKDSFINKYYLCDQLSELITEIKNIIEKNKKVICILNTKIVINNINYIKDEYKSKIFIENSYPSHYISCHLIEVNRDKRKPIQIEIYKNIQPIYHKDFKIIYDLKLYNTETYSSKYQFMIQRIYQKDLIAIKITDNYSPINLLITKSENNYYILFDINPLKSNFTIKLNNIDEVSDLIKKSLKGIKNFNED